MGVAKIIELVGGSKKGFEEAVEAALNEAAKSIRNIHGIHVDGFNVKVENNKIVEYRAAVKVAFGIERA